MWGTPQRSRSTVTGCCRPGSFNAPLTVDRAEWALACSDENEPADCLRPAAAGWVVEYARGARHRKPRTAFPRAQVFIAAVFPPRPRLVPPAYNRGTRP